MARLFISYCRTDWAKAFALRDWILREGWTQQNVFVFSDPGRGTPPGEDWRDTIKVRIANCDACLLVISRSWFDSEWCNYEFASAHFAGKPILPVLVEKELGAKAEALNPSVQFVELISEPGDSVPFTSIHPDTGVKAEVRFNKDKLTVLEKSLRKFGLDPEFFELVKDSSAPFKWRAPYRGLQPLEEEDAAVFFGRNADIAEGMRKLDELRTKSAALTLVVLGASGAGKSSYLRAGLLPRLKRRKTDWLPLKPVRAAQGKAINGSAGLLAVLEEAHRRVKIPQDLAELRSSIENSASFLEMIQNLRSAAADQNSSGDPPLVVLPVDQAEELFASEPGPECEELLRLARSGMDAKALLLLTTIRSDAVGALQSSSVLAGLHHQTHSLEPIPQGEIANVIRGPARVLRAKAPEAPEFDEAVVSKLLKEVESERDSLPLLAFAMERLMREHGSKGVIDTTDFEKSHNFGLVIEKAAETAIADGGLPQDSKAHLDALRAAFVPQLVRIDTGSKSPKRRVANWDRVPQVHRRLLDRLTDARLLVKKRPKDGVTTVEVAHEALLRNWKSLRTILEEEQDDLVMLERLERCASDWKEATDPNERAGRLAHRGGQWRRARELGNKGEWSDRIGDLEDYLEACAKADRDENRAREHRFLDRQLQLARFVAERSEEGHFDAAMRFALAGEIDQEAREKGYASEPNRLSHLARSAHRSRQLRLLGGHKEAIPTIAFSPDGKILATGSQDGHARLFDVASGQSIQARKLHESWINGIAFLPDGSALATGGRDRSVRIWSLTGDDDQLSLSPIPDEVRCVAVDQNGTHLACGYSNGVVGIWEIGTWSFLCQEALHSEAVLGLAFNSDGSRLASGSKDKTAAVWDVEQWRQVWRSPVQEREIHGVAFSPDGSEFATAGYDGTGRIWDSTTGDELRQLIGHQRELRSITYSPDGTQLATTSGDETLRIWNRKTSREVQQLRGHSGWVHAVQFSPDGTLLATGGYDHTARIWDPAEGSEFVRPTGCSNDLDTVAISPNGVHLATAGPREAIRLWDTANWSSSPLASGDSENTEQLAFSADGQRLMWLSSDRFVRSLNLRTGAIANRHGPFASKPAGFALCTDESRTVVAEENGVIHLFDTASSTKIADPVELGVKVTDVSISPEGRRLAAACADGRLFFWEIGQEGSIGKIEAHLGEALSLSFSPDGQELASAGKDWRARIWNAETGEIKGDLLGHDDEVWDISYSRDGTRIITACRDRYIRLWDAKAYVRLEMFPTVDQARAAALHPDGIFAVGAAKHGVVQVWDTVFLAALTGDRLARAVATHRLKGVEELTESEATELNRFVSSEEGVPREIVKGVLDLPPEDGSMDGQTIDAQIESLVDIWRTHRYAALEFERSQREAYALWQEDTAER